MKTKRVYFVYKGDEVVYVGQTCSSLPQRKGKHLSEARKGRGSILGAGIRKHGEDSFRWEFIEDFDVQEECCAFEKAMIAKYRPRYNKVEGGLSGYTAWNKGQKASPELRAKISLAAKNRKRTKRGPYAPEIVHKQREGKLRSCAKPFLCHQNGKTYVNKVEAASDLGIKPGGISAVLTTTTTTRSIHGYTFEYLAQGKSPLIDLEAQRWATGRKASASVND